MEEIFVFVFEERNETYSRLIRRTQHHTTPKTILGIPCPGIRCEADRMHSAGFSSVSGNLDEINRGGGFTGLTGCFGLALAFLNSRWDEERV